MVVVAVAVAYVPFLSLSNPAQILFDRLPVEVLVMDVDVDVVETLVYCLLLFGIIYFDEMVPIAEFKEIQKRDRREN
jgi:hypothetical protein